MTNYDPTPDDDALDALLRRHLGSAASTSEPPAQPRIATLLPTRRRLHRWSAPVAVAGGLIAAATATVLFISSTAPSSGPTVGVAPSGPSAATAGTTGTSTASSTSADEMGRAPAPKIMVNGTDYTLVGAVPWYSAMRIGTTVAVSTGPEIRGACDPQIYRLGASRSPSGELILTSYQYNPPKDRAEASCVAIGLPPYVAALQLEEVPPSQVLDGSRSSEGARPLTRVLVPTELPAGFAPSGTDPEFGQQPDPDRPEFNAYRSFFVNAGGQSEGAIGQNFNSGTQSLTVTQGLPAFTSGYDTLARTTVGPYPATVHSFQDAPERCVRWTGDPVGRVEVCGTLDGGGDALIAVARSIYAPTTTTSAAPSASTGPGKQISVNGTEYTLVGAVPWYGAMRIGNTVAVSTGPEPRGACDEQIYRLEATRSASGGLVLTSYRYDPVDDSGSLGCDGLGLPPYVAALQLKSPSTTAMDGARPEQAAVSIARVLVPTKLPPGFSASSASPEYPQLRDPDRPLFPAFGSTVDNGAVLQSFTSGDRSLIVTQGVKDFPRGDSLLDRTTVGPYQATIHAYQDSPRRCVRWTGDPAGWVEVCGTLDGDADAVVAVARSIYPTQ